MLLLQRALDGLVGASCRPPCYPGGGHWLGGQPEVPSHSRKTSPTPFLAETSRCALPHEPYRQPQAAIGIWVICSSVLNNLASFWLQEAPKKLFCSSLRSYVKLTCLDSRFANRPHRCRCSLELPTSGPASIAGTQLCCLTSSARSSSRPPSLFLYMFCSPPSARLVAWKAS
jgi:hypothetical protein